MKAKKTEDVREYWKRFWNGRASSEDMFTQTGRSSSNLVEFFVMLKDLQKHLELNQADAVLDVGGAAGWLSLAVAPFVKDVTSFDYAEKMVEKAARLAADFSNMRVMHDDLLDMRRANDKTYDKVIVSSVLQYLKNKEQVNIALKAVSGVMADRGRAYFSLNPDSQKKRKHLESYKKLNWSSGRIEESLKMEGRRLWLDYAWVEAAALGAGFRKCRKIPINPGIWQSTHMFDFMAIK